MLAPEFSGSGSCLDSGCASVELLVVLQQKLDQFWI